MKQTRNGKRICRAGAALCALILCLSMMTSALPQALAEKSAFTPSDYVRSLEALLTETSNVTVCGVMDLTLDGYWLKTAELFLKQNDYYSVQQLVMRTECLHGDTDDVLSGYTVFGSTYADCENGYAFAQELYPLWERYEYGNAEEDAALLNFYGYTAHRYPVHKQYRLRQLLRIAATVADVLTAKDEWSCVYVAGTDGDSLTVALSGNQLPDGVQGLMNLLLPYLMNKYQGWPEESVGGDTYRGNALSDYCGRFTGLVSMLREAQAEELHLTATRDAEGRLTHVSGDLTLLLTLHSGEMHRVTANFAAEVYGYGTTELVVSLKPYEHYCNDGTMDEAAAFYSERSEELGESMKERLRAEIGSTGVRLSDYIKPAGADTAEVYVDEDDEYEIEIEISEEPEISESEAILKARELLSNPVFALNGIADATWTCKLTEEGNMRVCARSSGLEHEVTVVLDASGEVIALQNGGRLAVTLPDIDDTDEEAQSEQRKALIAQMEHYAEVLIPEDVAAYCAEHPDGGESDGVYYGYYAETLYSPDEEYVVFYTAADPAHTRKYRFVLRSKPDVTLADFEKVSPEEGGNG